MVGSASAPQGCPTAQPLPCPKFHTLEHPLLLLGGTPSHEQHQPREGLCCGFGAPQPAPSSSWLLLGWFAEVCPKHQSWGSPNKAEGQVEADSGDILKRIPCGDRLETSHLRLAERTHPAHPAELPCPGCHQDATGDTGTCESPGDGDQDESWMKAGDAGPAVP